MKNCPGDEITEDEIEGCIFKINGAWITNVNIDGKSYRIQVEYNPWTGEKL